MKKKSIISVLLALCLTVCLFACNGGKDGGKNNGPITCTEEQAAEKFGNVLKAFDGLEKSTVTIVSEIERTVKKEGQDDVTRKSSGKTVASYDGTANKLIIEGFSTVDSMGSDGSSESGSELVLQNRSVYAKGENVYAESNLRYKNGELDKDNSSKQNVSDAYFKAMKRYLAYDESTIMVALTMGTVSHAGAVYDNGKLTFDGAIEFPERINEFNSIHAKVDINESGTGTYKLELTSENQDDTTTQAVKQSIEMKLENTVTMPDVTVPNDLQEKPYPDEDADIVNDILDMGFGFAAILKMTDGTLTTEYEYFENLTVTKVAAATVYEVRDYENHKYYTYFDFADTNKGKVYYEDYFLDQEDLGEYLDFEDCFDYFEGTLTVGEETLTLTNDKATVTTRLSKCGFPNEIKCEIKAVGSTPASTVTITFSTENKMTKPSDSFFDGFTLKTAE